MSTRYGRPTQADNDRYCALTVGQHVVCVDDSAWDRSRVTALPHVGKVYTVRALRLESTHLDGLRLMEMRCLPAHPSVPVCHEPCCGGEYWLQPDRFRPLQKLTPETFMSTDAPVKQGEPA